MRVVTINTYAGSLLLGAQMAGLEVDMSLEDSKFGVDIQRMNYPGLSIFQDQKYWPDADKLEKVAGFGTRDLRNHVVIAHPPCSAFSVQNNAKDRKGAGSDAFACTIHALEWAMGHQARVILVESVMGAMEGAKEVHEDFARRNGYDLYRFLVNSASFGVPQWRQRFWAAWVKQPGAPSEGWPVFFKPRYVKLKDVMLPSGRVDMQIDAPMRRQTVAWDREAVDDETRHALLDGARGFGLIPALMSGSKDYDKWGPGGFRSKHLRMLDPEGYAPVLMLDSGWLLPGRRLYVEEYFRIMGFPADYKMPQNYLKSQYKMYLSKGVCPPVAAWFLEQSKHWFPESYDTSARAHSDAKMYRVFSMSEALDLLPDKKAAA